MTRLVIGHFWPLQPLLLLLIMNVIVGLFGIMLVFPTDPYSGDGAARF